MTDYDPVAQAQAHLDMVTLERRLVELKDEGDTEAVEECKLELRAARQRARSERVLTGISTVETEGDGGAQPRTVKTAASVKDN
jgi:hypothetical protein